MPVCRKLSKKDYRSLLFLITLIYVNHQNMGYLV